MARSRFSPRSEYPAAAAGEPRQYRAIAENGICIGQFAAARSFAGRANQTPQDEKLSVTVDSAAIKRAPPTSDAHLPTRNGTLRKHRTQLLELCKAAAERAELSPDTFWLHNFRATFATKHLQAGDDLRTVQMWLGHKDMESTMRYLKPARGKGVRAKVNATFA